MAVSHKELVRLAHERVLDRNANPDKYRGFPTPYRSVNYFLTGGKQATEFSIWAARPSVGKTALLLDMAEASADYGTGAIFFSLEMSPMALGLRLLGKRAGVNLAALANEEADEGILEQLGRATEFAPGTADLMVEYGSLSVTDIKEKTQAVIDGGTQISEVYVDYVQLLKLESDQKGGTRQQDLGVISRYLKIDVAMEMGVHVAAAAQLSRKVEEREDRRPLLSDLREAGDLEQDADVVGLMFRPSYYGLAEYTSKASGHSIGYPDIEDYIEVNVAKQRNGPTGCADLVYDRSVGRFQDWGEAA